MRWVGTEGALGDRSFHPSRAIDCLSLLQRVSQSIALPGAVNDMSLVSYPVQYRRRQCGIAKNLGPVSEAEVCGNEYRLSLVKFSKDLEDQIGTLFGKWDISKCVNDQERIAGIPFQRPR